MPAACSLPAPFALLTCPCAWRARAASPLAFRLLNKV